MRYRTKFIVSDRPRDPAYEFDVEAPTVEEAAKQAESRWSEHWKSSTTIHVYEVDPNTEQVNSVCSLIHISRGSRFDESLKQKPELTPAKKKKLKSSKKRTTRRSRR